MANQKIILRPGVNRQATPLLNEATFSFSNLIRFKDGMLQKLGGWIKFIAGSTLGVCRGLFSWQDLDGIQYVVQGTNLQAEVTYQGDLYDISPVTSTANLATPFTALTGVTNQLQVTDVAHGASAGDVITIVNKCQYQSQVLENEYVIDSVIDADNYIIDTNKVFSGPAAAGGTAMLFNTTNTSASVQVTLNGHGLISGQAFFVHVSTTVGGLTLFGEYVVDTVVNANTFTFLASGNATSTTSGSENAGNIRINYLLAAGEVSATPSAGYGVGPFGYGGYGIGSGSGAIVNPRRWFFGNWGELLLANPSDEGIYVWDPNGGVADNPMTVIATAPTNVASMFIAMPQRQVVALGAEDAGVQDPLLIRWSDVDDYTEWTGAVTNQAGKYRLPKGSRIVGGIQGPQMGFIWTDLGLWGMAYAGSDLVYGFTELGSGCGLAASRGMGIAGGVPYWISLNGFFAYNGAVQAVPCPIWDIIFRNLNTAQIEKVVCAVNSAFNEIAWHFPALDGSGENDTYVKLNVSEGVWDYGTMTRTAWLDQSVVGLPLGTDANGYLYQHETSTDADDIAMDSWAETGLFKISDGANFIFIERMYPDFKLDGTGAELTLTLYTQDYPNQAQRSKTFTIDANTDYVIIRVRGRFAALKIESNDMGSFYRLGELIYAGSAQGRR